MVSVIVPVYNAEADLESCIVSILTQTDGNLELLLVNDGSTDGSQAIMEDWAKRDSRIRLLKQPNRGVSAARNLGLSKAKGEFATFVDSDDTVSGDYLASAQALIEGVSLAAMSELCPGDPYWGDAHILEDGVFALSSDEERMRFMMENFLPCKLGYGLHGKLFRMDFLRKYGIRFPKGVSLGEDMAFLMLCLMRAEGVSVSSQTVYTYYNREHSLSSGVKGKITLREYDGFLSGLAGELPGQFWEACFPVLYMRTMDIQFRQKPAREMAANLVQLDGCRLWKKMAERGAHADSLFRKTLGWKDGSKLYGKLCLYGYLTDCCPVPQCWLGWLLALVLRIQKKERENV